MRKVKQRICSNASTDEERFELVKKEAKINQGELSSGEKAIEFINNVASIFSAHPRDAVTTKIKDVVGSVVDSFSNMATGLISITKPCKHELRELKDIAEALALVDDTKKFTVISAPHGSGKTSKVAKVIIDQSVGRVAYVSHLKSIIEGACNNLNMTSYLSAGNFIKDQVQCGFSKNDALKHLDMTKLAICINSVIGPLDTWLDDLDLLVIDEFTQVLSCIATSSLPNFKHKEVFDKLTRMIQSAKKVLVLDSDMNDLAIRFLEFCCPEEKHQIFVQPRLSNGINTELCICERQDTAIGEVLIRVSHDLSSGSKVAIATDSINISIEIKEYIKSLNPDKKVLLINSKTAQSKEVTEFTNDSSTSLELHRYDVIVYSPSLTSGVSIEKNYFDYGYACFTGQSIESSNAIQMLRRVRSLKDMFVALVAKAGEDVQSSDQREAEQKHFAQAFGDFQPFTNFSKFVNEYDYYRRWNMAYFPYVFEKQLIEYGFNVTYTSSGANGELVKGEMKEDLSEAVLCADSLTKGEYDVMVYKTSLSIEERASILAYEICEEFQIDHAELTLPIVKFWGEGKGSHTLKLYDSLLSMEWVGSHFSERDVPHALRRYENIQLLSFDLLLSLSGLKVDHNRVTGNIEGNDLCRLQQCMKLLAPMLSQLKIICSKHYKFKASHAQIKHAFEKVGIFLKIKRVRDGNGKRKGKLVIDDEMMEVVYELRSRAS
ncbi:hypothetical protein CGI77_09630 [Vibrio parahaemolyticus]|uniref:plasmid replication protein, CyRepA1 family n=1 Tax=Vibrio parahaemolyticus TaxID=670 RepID=UPI0011205C6E|nr:plasmid replication protein, CyRepA1 family [Vibrio parahaemolyticus]TOH58851.1 hypothetical protein CGI77_09630 [Vibrio parahaemolyticus]